MLTHIILSQLVLAGPSDLGEGGDSLICMSGRHLILRVAVNSSIQRK